LKYRVGFETTTPVPVEPVAVLVTVKVVGDGTDATNTFARLYAAVAIPVIVTI
jgi:hypothetical protein